MKASRIVMKDSVFVRIDASKNSFKQSSKHVTGDGQKLTLQGEPKIYKRALELKLIINKNFLEEHALEIPSKVENSLKTWWTLYNENFNKREDFFIVDSDEFYWFDPAAKNKIPT